MQMLRVKIWIFTRSIWIFTRSIWFFCDCVHRDWLWYMRHRTKMNWHHYIWAVSFSIETRIVSKPTMEMSIIELLRHQTYRVNIVLIFKRRQASHKFNRDNSTKKKLNTSSAIIWKMELILYCICTHFATWPLFSFMSV